jgi:hypothetical protein
MIRKNIETLEDESQKQHLAFELPQYSLTKLVFRITPENKHDYAESDFGTPIGKELL